MIQESLKIWKQRGQLNLINPQFLEEPLKVRKRTHREQEFLQWFQAH